VLARNTRLVVTPTGVGGEGAAKLGAQNDGID
jgi:hypothetical protein